MTRFAWVTLTCIASLSGGAATALHPAPRLIWNASASVPVGLYVVHPAGALHIAELVVVMPPQPLATFLAERRYLPKGVPLLKRVLALSSQTVCRADRTITVDGVAMGQALERDRRGHPLPVWRGCHVVSVGEVFLMNSKSEDSLDGRYFGVLPTSTIVGRAVPLWTDEEH
jgi:conjugative transfer signal peptidase TraF